MAKWVTAFLLGALVVLVCPALGDSEDQVRSKRQYNAQLDAMYLKRGGNSKTKSAMTKNCDPDDLPELPNSRRSCSTFSGCRYRCRRGFAFTSGESILYSTCHNGAWIIANYDQGANLPVCAPVCQTPCQNNGICVQPNVCSCPPEFEGDHCQYGKAEPCMEPPPKVPNAKIRYSTTKGTVECLDGFKLANGAATMEVVCKDGDWVFQDYDFTKGTPMCEPVCDPACMNNGKCVAPHHCLCPKEYAGEFCQYSRDQCNPSKLTHGGGYKCSSSSTSYTCVITCPKGIGFESPPAENYVCLYADGYFTPTDIPKCHFPEGVSVHWVGNVGNASFTSSGSSLHGGAVGSIGGATVTEGKFHGIGSFFLDSNIHLEKAALNFGLEDIEVFKDLMGQHSASRIRAHDTICRIWSDSHYQTFDGGLFSFKGNCEYVLSRDSNNRFTLLWSPSQETITLYLLGEKYVAQKSRETGDLAIQWRGQTHLLPFIGGEVVAEVAGSSSIMQVTSVGLNIFWHSTGLLEVVEEASLWNSTMGLCGNPNGIPGDDFLCVDGYLRHSVKSFVKSWVPVLNGAQCEDDVDSELACSNEGSKGATKANSMCSHLLTNPVFEECRKVINPKPYVAACEVDFCLCSSILEESGECGCATLQAYVLRCKAAKIHIASWRDDGLCPMPCAPGEEYRLCGNGAHRQCGTAAAKVNDDEEEATAIEVCVEGCYCPQGFDRHPETLQCVPRADCPCSFRGKVYGQGDVVLQECNSCECLDGEWKCTTQTCGARCSVVGDPHYTTFDGKTFDFQGKCSYYLLKGEDYSIQVENVPCSGAISEAMNFPQSMLKLTPSCAKSVTITLGDQVIQLFGGGQVTINGVTVKRLPYLIRGVYIRKVSSVFITVDLYNGLKVWWDSFARVYVDAPAELRGKTVGLCGTFDLKQNNDFLTPEGDVEQNPTSFAHKWRAEDQCELEVEPPHPCETNPANYEMAKTVCMLLQSDIFTACHEYVEPTTYVRSCMYDTCACANTHGNSGACMCPALSDYAQACIDEGIHIAWRSAINQCGLHCMNGEEYQTCSSACVTTCRDINLKGENLEGTKCQERCVEGCACPEGMVKNDEGQCILKEECPCIYHDREFSNGYQLLQKTLGVVQNCICSGGSWECERLDGNQTMVGDQPQCDEDQVFTYCESPNPLTCQNMHAPPAQQTPKTCESGCECPGDRVLDKEAGKCVYAHQCPCHHGGVSYSRGDVINQECNTCICTGSQWKCTQLTCPSVCHVWGGHVLTFDQRLYDFDGICAYVLFQAVETTPFKVFVAIQNVACGTSGRGCSKAIKVTAGNETVVLRTHTALPPTFHLRRLVVREAGLFVFIDIPAVGVVVQWDRSTRISIRAPQSLRGAVEGLCGNYNGNELDDFTTPAKSKEVSVINFVASWAMQSYCRPPRAPRDECQLHPERRAWAESRCQILMEEVFEPCHAEVPPKAFYHRCVQDACSCDMGGDCECLCTAVAIYEQLCASRGVPVRWRSQELCPIQCDANCSHYEPCIETCPETTCENHLVIKAISKMCHADTCVEGCKLEGCPEGKVYLSMEDKRCVPVKECKTPCLQKDGVLYYEGDLISSDACHSCYCSRNQIRCKGSPCTTPTTPTTTPTTITSTTTLSTTTSTSTSTSYYVTPATPIIDIYVCVDGWTYWHSNGHPADLHGMDVEPVITNSKGGTPGVGSSKSTICATDQVTDIECRVIGTQVPWYNSGDNVTCDPLTGLTCDNGPGQTPCKDYEIRVKCSCEEACRDGFSSWMNINTPNNTAQDDIEGFDDLRERYTFCQDHQIVIVSCRPADRNLRTQRQNIVCDRKNGLVCLGENQAPNGCHDYEIQVFCNCGLPVPPTTSTTTPSTTTTRPVCIYGELRDVYDDCSRYETCDGTAWREEVCPDGLYFLHDGCYSPSVVVEERKECEVLTCQEGSTFYWTHWFNTTHPSEDGGDYERVKLLKMKGYDVCDSSEIIGVECVYVDVDEQGRERLLPSSQSGEKVSCKKKKGLACNNVDGRICSDYAVRFKCKCEHKEEPPVVVCPDGMEWSTCAIRCADTCHVYKARLEHERKCEVDCIPGCGWPEYGGSLCPPGQVAYNDKACIAKDGCSCILNGNLLKPTETFKTTCETYQCIDNEIKVREDCCKMNGEWIQPGETYVINECQEYICEGNKMHFVDTCISSTPTPLECDTWTDWQNHNYPNEKGEFEILSDLRKDNTIFETYCEYRTPDLARCRISGQDDLIFNNINATEVTGQNVRCDAEGLICYSDLNLGTDGNGCYDYEIQYFCACEPFTTTTPATTTTTATTTPIEISTTITTTTTMVTPPAPCDESFVSLIRSQPRLPNSAFSASSSTKNFEPWRARLDGFQDEAWTPNTNDKDIWLEVDLGNVVPVYGVILGSPSTVNRYVTSAVIFFSTDKQNWHEAKDYEKERLKINGPTQPGKSVRTILPTPFEARYIRLVPVTWNQYPVVKIDILGCGVETTTVTSSTTTVIFVTPPECQDDMGIDNEIITPDQITVSSSISHLYTQEQLPLNSTRSWIADISKGMHPFVLIDLQEPRNLTGIVTAGFPATNYFVSSFQVWYGFDPSSLVPVKEPSGRVKEFPGNTDGSTPVTNWFDTLIRARYVKVIVRTYTEAPALRLQIKGCYEGYTTVITTTPVTVTTSTSTVTSTSTSTSTTPISVCNTCPGYNLQDEAQCSCDDEHYWDGVSCVTRDNCPCYENGKRYEVSSVYITEDCRECTCNLYGNSECHPQVCQNTCGENERWILSDTCACECESCPENYTLCVSSNICLSEQQLCDDVRDCDIEICPTTTTISTTVPTTTEAPPPSVSECKMEGRTYTTFDGIVYQYDICNHTFAQDKINYSWEVNVAKKCESGTCHRYIEIRQDDHYLTITKSLAIEYDLQTYSLHQAQKIGSNYRAFTLSRVGNSIIFESAKYGFWVEWNTHMDAVIGVTSKLLYNVNGLCGLYSGTSSDDYEGPDGEQVVSSQEFGDLWSLQDEECEEVPCLDTVQERAKEECRALTTYPFEQCYENISSEAFLYHCAELICQCTIYGEDFEKCRCGILSSYATECMASMDNDEDLYHWRSEHKCEPPKCKGDMEYHQCYDMTNYKTCDTLMDKSEDTYVDTKKCVEGCFCPHGTVLMDEDKCVKPEKCRDCVCEGFGDPHFTSFDNLEYIFNGNCTYVASRDIKHHGSHDFQVLVTTVNCDDEADTTCVEGLTLISQGNMLILRHLLGEEEIHITHNDEEVIGFPADLGWAVIEEHVTSFLVLVPSIQLELQYFIYNYQYWLRLPSHFYYNRTEGLCGNCNNDPSDDTVSRDGVINDSIDDFALSWLVKNPPTEVHQTEETCVVVTTPECRKPNVTDICDVIYEEILFGQCHHVIDPKSYYEACKYDVCHSTNPDSSKCRALLAYARRCQDIGICLNWRSEHLCPAKCPAGMEYKPCISGCAATCDTINLKTNPSERREELDYSYDYDYINMDTVTEVDTSYFMNELEEQCEFSIVDGCVCPWGQVLDRGRCVDAITCHECQGGHRYNTNWLLDECTNCTCTLEGTRCEVEKCQEVYCGYNATNQGKCCSKVECTHKPCEYTQKYYVSETGYQVPISDEDSITTFRNANETWEDGLCQKCTCQEEGKDTSMKIVCQEETCPTPAEDPRSEDYVVVEKPEPYKCCPQLVPIACKVGDVSYKENERFEDPNGDPCIYWKCEASHPIDITKLPPVEIDAVPVVEENALVAVVKKEYIRICNNTCAPGYEYKEPSSNDICCGECVLTSCVVSNGQQFELGEQWQSDDFCISYNCTYDGNIASTKKECSPPPENKDFVYTSEKVQGQCCPVFVAETCIIEGQLVEPGSSVQVDECTESICKRNEEHLEIKDIVKECTSSNCGPDEERVKEEGACCSSCKRVRCLLGNETYEPNETWYLPDDPCTQYSCIEVDTNQLQVEKVKASCPPIPDNCPAEYLETSGCCQVCRAPPPETNCTAMLVPSASTIGYFRYNSYQYGTCYNKHGVEGFTECVGYCQSTSYYNSGEDKYTNNCHCCKPTKKADIRVKLLCPGGSSISHTFKKALECTCTKACDDQSEAIGAKGDYPEVDIPEVEPL
ncbi:hemocytin-like isoform X2 [Oratosquilla oratoria]|uniref:hemocytin-like isoform X2 n=1 Tax=Oratosquilla oratoria TaxID=337810 RepID=UPI003F757929